MRLLAIATALLMISCVKGGVNLDDTGVSEGDTDTDSDSDTDTDLALPESWIGTVSMDLAEQGMPFCEGQVSFALLDGTGLGGEGDCVLLGGPGQGQSLQLDFEGEVQAAGVVIGSISLVMPDMPEPLPPVELQGQVTMESLQLGFELEVSAPENPDVRDLVQGSVLAAPAD